MGDPWVMVRFEGNNQGGDALLYSMRMTAPAGQPESPGLPHSLSGHSAQHQKVLLHVKRNASAATPWPIVLEDQPLCPARGLSFSPTAAGSQPRLWSAS